MPPNRIPRPSSAKGQRRRPADGEGEGMGCSCFFFYNHTNIHACTYNQDETSRSIGWLKYNQEELHVSL